MKYVYILTDQDNRKTVFSSYAKTLDTLFPNSPLIFETDNQVINQNELETLIKDKGIAHFADSEFKELERCKVN